MYPFRRGSRVFSDKRFIGPTNKHNTAAVLCLGARPVNLLWEKSLDPRLLPEHYMDIASNFVNNFIKMECICPKICRKIDDLNTNLHATNNKYKVWFVLSYAENKENVDIFYPTSWNDPNTNVIDICATPWKMFTFVKKFSLNLHSSFHIVLKSNV